MEQSDGCHPCCNFPYWGKIIFVPILINILNTKQAKKGTAPVFIIDLFCVTD